jgi:hypothetical protein
MKPTTIAFAGLAVLALMAHGSPARADDASVLQIQQCRQQFPNQAQQREACETCPPPANLSKAAAAGDPVAIEEIRKHRLHPLCVISTAHGWDIIPPGRISPDEVLFSVGPAPEMPLRRDAASVGTFVQFAVPVVGDGPSAQPPLPTPVAEAPLGSCGYYINSSGDRVPRPCGNWHTQPPPQDATAECRDGTYSFSEHRNGTCSSHGGVLSFR